MTGNVGVHCVLTLVKYTKKTRTFQKHVLFKKSVISKIRKNTYFSKIRTFQKPVIFKNP